MGPDERLRRLTRLVFMYGLGALKPIEFYTGFFMLVDEETIDQAMGMIKGHPYAIQALVMGLKMTPRDPESELGKGHELVKRKFKEKPKAEGPDT